MSRKLIIDGNAVYELDENCRPTQALRYAETSIICCVIPKIPPEAS